MGWDGSTFLLLEQPFGLVLYVLLQPLLRHRVLVVADVAQPDLPRVEGDGAAARLAVDLPRQRPQDIGLFRCCCFWLLRKEFWGFIDL